jgi:MFS family permease
LPWQTSTTIATATPQITNEFHSIEDIGWYAGVYSMTACMSQLLYGKLCVRYPIRWNYGVAMLLFMVGSAICGASPNSPVLIVGRAVSGLGSSGLLVGAFSLVPFLAPPAKRPVLLSFMGTTRGLAVTFGPLIGGALTERASWRWNFYINLPLGVFIFAVFLATVRPPKRQNEGFTSWADFFETLDLFGFAALAPSVVCLLLALQWGGTRYQWSDGRIISLFVLFGVLGLVFITLEIRHGSKSMLPMRVFAQRVVYCANFYGFCTAGAIFVLTYYLPT